MSASPKPKPLRDVRYFEAAEPPRLGKSMPGYPSELYSFPTAAVALGQRVGMKCRELGISIGQADHLYVCFSPSKSAGSVELTEYAVEPWHRFVLCGLSSDFNMLTEEVKLAMVTEATFNALHLLAPDAASEVDSLRQMIDSEGEALRVKIKCKETKKYFIRVEQNVPVRPRHAEVFVHVTNLQKQLSKEAKVAEVRVYDEAPSLVDRIAITGDKLTIHPRKSFRASVIADDYAVPIQLDLAELGVA